MYLKFLILPSILFAFAYLNTYSLAADEAYDRLLHKRIIGGFNCDPLKYEFYVTFRVAKRDGTRILCSGSIISARHVLTSAHCCGNLNSGFVMTRAVRKQMRWTFRENITVKSVYVHNKFNTSTNDYDFAIVSLAKSLNLTKKSIVGLATPAYMNKVLKETNPRVDFFGYGQNVLNNDGTTGKNFSVPFQCISLKISNAKDCGEKIFNLGRMFCVMSPPKSTMSAAPGDSGGPVMHKNMQVGVISNGYPGKMTNVARVDAVLEWIKSYTGIKARTGSGASSLSMMPGLMVGGAMVVIS